MADVSKIKLPNNTTVNIKDGRITDKNTIVPLQTKTYEGTSFYATGTDNWNLATRYFMSVKPDSSTGYWHVKYRITIWIPASTARSETAIIEYFGYGITLNSFKIWNTLGTTYATYYHTAYWLTADGLNNGYGHAIGESILYATNYTTASWYRHMIVSLLEYEGCTVTLLDTPLKWSEWTGGNTTNYARGGTSPTTYNATSAGLQESGDSDSNSVSGYDAKAYKVGDTAIPAYNPIGEDKDGLLVPMLSKPFLARGPMYLCSSALSASTTGSWTGLYYTNYNIQIRNGSSYVEGVVYKPLYLKGTISGSMFTASSSSPYATALPSSEDNLFYYYLGETTASTASNKYTYISLKAGVHPIYYYKNGGLKLWSGDNIPSAPGTLNTTATTAQSTSSSEALSGSVTLHKVAKTGTYSDLIGKPTLDSTPTAGSTNAVTSGGVKTALDGTVMLTGDQTIAGTKTFSTPSSPRISVSTNSVYANAEDNVIAYSPFSWNAWHDHFAFLRYHEIRDAQYTTDGSTWQTSTTDIRPLFIHKENNVVQVLRTSDLAFRFTLYSNGYYHACQIAWIVLGVNYTSPFSSFNTKVEYSSDNSTWATWFDGNITYNQTTFFLKVGSLASNQKYLRFTFTKTTNTTTGYVTMNSINGLTRRKGNQGLGRENSLPFDWDADINLLPVTDGKALGSSSKRWAILGTTGNFSGAVTAGSFVKSGGTSSQFLKADGSVDSNTYVRTNQLPAAPGTLITNATSAQTASSGEAMSGNITLHKVSKTGTYSDLVGKPTVDSSPTASSSNLVSSGGVYTALQNILSQIVSFDNVSTNQDGTLIITLSNGDTITVDLNHNHPQYPKYEHLASESAMPATPDADTMYLIDGGGGGGANIVYLTSESQMPASPDANTLYVILES